MNKIYNNLSVENLIKTEWFNQFNKEQQFLIKRGLSLNVDVLLYAKKEFSDEQMRAILFGLVSNLDASFYAKEHFTLFEMSEIRSGLQANIDVSIYAKKEFDWLQMYEIRLGLQNNIDVSFYSNPNYSSKKNEIYKARIRENKRYFNLLKLKLFKKRNGEDFLFFR